MRETLANRALTYGLLGLFVLMVAVPLFWMVTTALKPNKDLYEDFSYFPRRPTLEHFVRVIQRDELLTNIRNSLAVALTTTAVTVVVSALTAFSIVRYRYRGREWIGRVILFKYLLPSAMLFVPLYAIVTSLGLGNTLKSLMLTYLSFTLAWNEFLLALVFTVDQSTMTVPIKLSMMVVGDQYIWGQLMAGAILASIPIAILYFIGQRFVVQGLAAGAVKG